MFQNNQFLTYEQLVFGQIKIIQNILSKELRDQELILKNALGEQTIEKEDTRYSFIQSVECLGNLLLPDLKEVQTSKDSFDEFKELIDMELMEALEDENFLKIIKKKLNTTKEKIISTKNLQVEANLCLLNEKVKEARSIFGLLMEVFNNADSSDGVKDPGQDTPGEEDDAEWE